MQEQVHYHIKQDAAVEAMIASSLYHCQTDRAFPDLKRLPDVTWEDVQRCWGHVSGHVRLMRQSSPQYYEQQKNVLSAHHAVLMYVHENFDAKSKGRMGDRERPLCEGTAGLCLLCFSGERKVRNDWHGDAPDTSGVFE